MPLTDTAIRNAKPRRNVSKLSDGGGLYLLIQPHGAKLWRLAYRFGGKQKTLALGIYPTVSLADARARRDAAKKILEDGGDPSVQRKLDKQARGNSFRLVAQELLDKMRREGRAAATLAKTQTSMSGCMARPILNCIAPIFTTCSRPKRGNSNPTSCGSIAGSPARPWRSKTAPCWRAP
jgi:Arm DNA-binding domain